MAIELEGYCFKCLDSFNSRKEIDFIPKKENISEKDYSNYDIEINNVPVKIEKIESKEEGIALAYFKSTSTIGKLFFALFVGLTLLTAFFAIKYTSFKFVIYCCASFALSLFSDYSGKRFCCKNKKGKIVQLTCSSEYGTSQISILFEENKKELCELFPTLAISEKKE